VSETLYRAMSIDEDGQPRLGASSRTLGVRPLIDVPGDAADVVDPGVGGMSVTIEDPMLLPTHRRPSAFGGTGPDPLFAIEREVLGPDLEWRADFEGPSGHGFVEPVRTMTFDEYQEAIWATRSRWRQVVR